MLKSNERSAEWLRIAMEAMEVYRETHETWEEMYARYERLLAAAEAREGGENAAEISADRAWIDGAKFGWNCETKTDLHEAIANRQLQIREAVVKCPRCDSPDPSLHPAMQLEGEVQPCGDLWHTPATEVIHGDSLSTTVEKLREACQGVRVAPAEINSPTAAEVIEAAEKALERLLPWALQAGANAEDALALCARWKEANGGD